MPCSEVMDVLMNEEKSSDVIEIASCEKRDESFVEEESRKILENLKNPSTYEATLRRIPALVVHKTPLAESILSHALHFVVQPLLLNNLSVNNISSQLDAAEIFCNILQWGDNSIFGSMNISLPSLVQSICVSVISTFEALEKGNQLESKTCFFFLFIKWFNILSLLCEFTETCHYVFDAWGKQFFAGDVNTSETSLSLSCCVVSFASKDDRFSFWNASIACYEALRAATRLCLSLLVLADSPLIFLQRKSNFLFDKKYFYQTFQPLLALRLWEGLKEKLMIQNQEEIFQDLTLSLKGWICALIDFFINFTDCEPERITGVEDAHFTICYDIMEFQLNDQIFDLVCDTLSKLDCDLTSNGLATEKLLMTEYNLNKEESFSDEKEIAASLSFQQTVQLQMREIETTGIIFTMLKRLFEIQDTTKTQVKLERNNHGESWNECIGANSSEDLDEEHWSFLLPNSFLVNAENNNSSALKLCREAIAASVQLPNLILVIESRFGTTLLWDFLRAHLVAQQNSLEFYAYCLLAANAPTSSCVIHHSASTVHEPLRNISCMLQSLNATLNLPVDVYLSLLKTLQNLVEVSVVCVEHLPASCNVFILPNDIQNICTAIHQKSNPYKSSEVRVSGCYRAEDLWQDIQLSLCDLFSSLIKHSKDECILRLGIQHALDIMENSLKLEKEYLERIPVIAEIFFEAFKDESFDFMFSDYSTLSRLSQICEKLNAGIARFTLENCSYHQDLNATLANLTAFLKYKEKFVPTT